MWRAFNKPKCKFLFRILARVSIIVQNISKGGLRSLYFFLFVFSSVFFKCFCKKKQLVDLVLCDQVTFILFYLLSEFQ